MASFVLELEISFSRKLLTEYTLDPESKPGSIETLEKKLDTAAAMFLNMLKYKLADRGKYFIKVDKWYPSSQICSCCGKQKKFTLTDRIYECDCGLTINRDLNAAINIRNEGLRILKSA